MQKTTHSPIPEINMVKIAPCLWFNGSVEKAAQFYARTFPDSDVGKVHQAPTDYPNGKAGDPLTVEFDDR